MESGKLSAKAVKRAIMTGCRNKIAFGGLSAEDAKEFAEEFGKKQIIVRQATYDTKIIGANLFPSNYRDTEQEEYRFFYTQLMDGLPRFHFVAKLLKDGTPQPPIIGRGKFIPHDWKQRREWEDGASTKRLFHFIKKREPLFHGLKGKEILSEIQPNSERRSTDGIHFIEPDGGQMDWRTSQSDNQQQSTIFIENEDSLLSPSAPFKNTDSFAGEFNTSSAKAMSERGDQAQNEEELTPMKDEEGEGTLPSDPGQEDKKRKIRPELF